MGVGQGRQRVFCDVRMDILNMYLQCIICNACFDDFGNFFFQNFALLYVALYKIVIYLMFYDILKLCFCPKGKL